MPGIRSFKNGYRYGLYILAVLLKGILRFLPRLLALPLGKVGGIICFYSLARERKKVLKHLKIAFPAREDIARIAKEVFKNLGMNLVEWFQMPYLNKKKIGTFVRISGLDKIEKELRRGKGAIVLTSHFGNWEYLAGYFALQGFEGAVVARKISYAPYNKLLVQIRRAQGVESLWRDGSVRKLIKVLKQNKLLGILPDQDTDKVDGIFINFFNRPAYTPTGPVNLAMATGANIIPCFIIREGNNHHIVVEEPLPLVKTKDKKETIRINTEQWSAVVERYIRRYPEQWVWMHRRWQTKQSLELKIEN